MAESVVFPMNVGDSLYSYSKNSSFSGATSLISLLFITRKAIDAVKELIKEAVFEKLDIKIFSFSNTFRVTDLGCAAGPNTFVAVENILDALEHKYRSQEKGVHNSDQLPEFQVFFSDQTSNDLNELFRSLPPVKGYHAVGVPGSFYSRLFPKAFLHFVYSSYSLHKVPKEVEDMNSPAWNKGRIHYSKSADQVVKAYAAQYAKDMECFLNARAQEIVCGGLMAFIVPGRSNGTPHAQTFVNMAIDLFGSCLMDLANKNRPYYAAGAPGSFYGRIFPKASIHFVHSSYANHWLSRVPKDCPAWNKGVRAYEAQYAEDMECFLHARAQEIVYGGLMILIIPGYSHGTPLSHSMANLTLQLLGSCLMDMTKKVRQ